MMETEEIHIEKEEKKEIVRFNRNFRFKLYEQEGHKCPKCDHRREVKDIKYTFSKPGKYLLKIIYLCKVGCELNNIEESWKLQEVSKSIRFEEIEKKYHQARAEISRLKKKLKITIKEEKATVSAGKQ